MPRDYSRAFKMHQKVRFYFDFVSVVPVSVFKEAVSLDYNGLKEVSNEMIRFEFKFLHISPKASKLALLFRRYCVLALNAFYLEQYGRRLRGMVVNILIVLTATQCTDKQRNVKKILFSYNAH